MTSTTVSTAVTKKESLSDGDSLTVTSTGSVILTSNNDAVPVASQTTGVTIDNFGTIEATVAGDRAIKLSGPTQTNVLITNEVGGKIIATNDDAIHGGSTNTLLTAGSVTILNYGSISTTGNTGDNNGQGIDLDNTGGTFKSTITNYGTITTADADAIRTGINATVNNYGTISGGYAPQTDGDTDGSDGIDFQSQTGGVVNNYAGGTIVGARHGITGKNAITVTNAGTIQGTLGSGINMDTTSGTTLVTNSAGGLIVGNAGSYSYVDSNGATQTVSVDGDGIDVDYLVNIQNYGAIEAFGTSTGSLSEAITVGGGEIDNYAGGLIYSVQRAITVDDSNLGNAFGATTIYNEGTITGADGEAISITDTFADTITNKGVINGSVALGGGDDVYNDYAGSTLTGTLDGGTGTDTLNLLGTGAGSFGSVINFETLNVTSGSWTFTATEAFDTVSISSGASLQIGNGGLTGSLSGTITDNGSLIADTSGIVNLSSAISGTGTVTVEGGTLVLQAGNSYSGGTTINGGTLEVAHANGAGTGAITMAAGNQTLVLDSAAFSNGDFANVIEGFGAGDKIDLAGVTNATSVNLGANNELLVSLSNGSTLTLHLDPSESFAGEYFHLGTDSAGGLYITEDSQPCYCPGTLILTERGERPVEDLVIGDRLVTASGAVRPIKWIGRRSYSGRFILGRADIQPICIQAGALGTNRPRRDLWISPHHAMYLEGVLIEAHALVNEASIVQPMNSTDVSYFHIELDSHDIIIAEGALSESFVDDDSRMMFQNAHEYAELYGTDAKPAIYCAPRKQDGAEVERARAFIASLADIDHDGSLAPEWPRGMVERVGGGRVEGWIVRPSQLDALNHVEILVAGQLVGHALADMYRSDLEAVGIGHGRHAFSFDLPTDIDPSTVQVRCGRTAVTLPRSMSVSLIDILAA